MCKDCGCGTQGGSKIFFMIQDFAGHSAKEVEKQLLGLPWVYHVHIHQHDGQASIDYNGTQMSEIDFTNLFTQLGITASRCEHHHQPLFSRVLKIRW